ncbi:hypothetical protein QUF82_07540 [Thiotrichales bacterium HSG14]|nr:hypothetical protein [Thiotrichales bacterium HSG14]
MQVIGIAKSCVKKEGLNKQKHQEFKQLIKTSQITSEVALELAAQLGDFLKDEGELFADRPVIYKLQKEEKPYSSLTNTVLNTIKQLGSNTETQYNELKKQMADMRNNYEARINNLENELDKLRRELRD